MSGKPAMDDLVADELDTHFTQLEARLVDVYADAARPVVHQAVEEERERFTEARVHAFVPVLVERSVRTRLGKPDHDQRSPGEPDRAAPASAPELRPAPSHDRVNHKS